MPEKNKRLTDILKGIAEEINFGDFQSNDIDAFGDAYEYLISNYASNAGNLEESFHTSDGIKTTCKISHGWEDKYQ